MELMRSLEVLHNYVHEIKSELVQKKKNMNNNKYSQSAFDGAVERMPDESPTDKSPEAYIFIYFA